MSKLSGRDKLLQLTEYFSHETLLNEIIAGMSGQEASEMADHIDQMHDLNLFDSEEEE